VNPVGFYGLGCPEEEGWIGFLARKAAPYAPYLGLVAGVVVAVRLARGAARPPRARGW
jgi:hypothetical protein